MYDLGDGLPTVCAGLVRQTRGYGRQMSYIYIRLMGSGRYNNSVAVERRNFDCSSTEATK